jgi:hypothetical protein
MIECFAVLVSRLHFMKIFAVGTLKKTHSTNLFAAAALLCVSSFFCPISVTAFTSGNLLISREDNHNFSEYTRTGNLLQTITVPLVSPAGGESQLRDLVVDGMGQISLFLGTFHPVLARYSPDASAFTYQTTPGWGMANNGTYGGIAASGNYVFVSDGRVGTDLLGGVVRFNLADGTSQRFLPDIDFMDINLGLDGQLYALDEYLSVYVFDPLTMAFQRKITLDHFYLSERGIAVDAEGSIYAANWDGYIDKFDATGHQTGILKVDIGPLDDIDIDADGTVAVGASRGGITLVDKNLNPATMTTFYASDYDETFVSFIKPSLVAVPEVSSTGPLGAAILYGIIILRNRRRKTLGRRLSA